MNGVPTYRKLNKEREKMGVSAIEELIAKANRDNIDSAESETMFITVEAHCKSFQRDIVKTGIYFYMVEKYKLYKNAGEKNTRTLLRGWGYSYGAISHLMAYGEFCCRMKFTDFQLPPEHVVRQILVKELRDDWCKIYRAACKLASDKHVERKNFTSEKSPENKGDIKDDEDSESQDSESKSENIQIDGGDMADPEGNAQNNGQEDGTQEDGTQEDKNENSLPFECESTQSENLLDIKPSISEIRQVVREFKMNDPKNIYLFSIGEKMPREGNFASAVLENYKEKLKTVSILCRVVQDFMTAGGALTEQDTSALEKFCADIHAREKEDLQNAINGVPEENDGGESIAEDVKE